MTYETKKKRLELRRAQLDNERSSFVPHWRELARFIRPRRPRFLTSDVNKGDRRNQDIIDNTATIASRTLRSGMVGGITSPARRWFRLTTPDSELAEFGRVKLWLDDVTRLMSASLLKSNFYNAIPAFYGDLGDFGTAALGCEEDELEISRFYTFPIGSYRISTNARGIVDVYYRDFQMTVREVVEKFGQINEKSGAVDWSNISRRVKEQYERGNYEAWVEVTHVIEPNLEYDPKKIDSKYKKYASCYYERDSSPSEDKYLRESGYDRFPVLCARWETSGEDVYGTDCPGMTVLGDVRALQTMQRRKAQAIEKKVNPPMIGDPALRAQAPSILPGEITYINSSQRFEPAFRVEFNIQELSMDIRDTQMRIQRGYYEDLFLMISNSDRREITATEIDERKEEKLLALGPVLEQVNQDLLDPLIDLQFHRMLKAGLLPPPPQELEGVDLKVEYESIMALAQKMGGLASVERFSGFVAQAAQFDQSALQKIDVDQLIDVYADITGVPPSIVRSDEDVEAIRQAQAQQQAAQMQSQNAMASAKSLRDLSQTSLEGNNALTAAMKASQAGSLVN